MSGITVDETPVLVIQRNSDKTRQVTASALNSAKENSLDESFKFQSFIRNKSNNSLYTTILKACQKQNKIEKDNLKI